MPAQNSTSDGTAKNKQRIWVLNRKYRARIPGMDDKRANRARQEKRLDEALKETFPASDPVAIQPVGARWDAAAPDAKRDASPHPPGK
jgi:hypothetical protein